MKLGEGYAHLNWLSANVTSQVSDNFMLGGALTWVGFGATMKASARLGDNLFARWWNSTKNSLGEFALMLMITEDGDALPIPWFGKTWPF